MIDPTIRAHNDIVSRSFEYAQRCDSMLARATVAQSYVQHAEHVPVLFRNTSSIAISSRTPTNISAR